MIDVGLIGFGVVMTYFILLLLSLRYSCGGWDRSCGLCWVAIVQAPLILIDWLIDKVKGGKKDG
jgi:hypothetical protein